MNRRIVTVLVSSLFAPGGTLTAAEYFDLGPVTAASVSGDGSVVVGGTDYWSIDSQAFIWNRTNGMRTLGPPGTGHARQTSFDGTVVAGRMSDGDSGWQLFLWNEVDGLTGLGAPPGFSNVDNTSISADGRTVAGRAWNPPIYDFEIGRNIYDWDAWRWTAEDGFVSLGRPDGADSSAAYDISADGKVIVGVYETLYFDGLREIVGSPFLWTEENGFQDLGPLPLGWESAAARRVSSDGSTVAGEVFGEDFSSGVFRWTSEEGLQTIPPLPGAEIGQVSAITADGSIIAGGFFNRETQKRFAFIWDEEHGTRDLRDVLIAEHGFTASQLPSLQYVRGLSADETVIVGYNPVPLRSWAIYLDKPLVSPLGDFDDSHYLDAADIDLLSQAVGGPDLSFDLNSDQAVDESDRVHWVHDLVGTYFGDANLDGEFNSSDFTSVFLAGEYEDAIDDNSGWASGDWDGDADFTSKDMITAFLDGGYEQGPRSAVSAVPEPTSAWLLLVGALLLVRRAKPVTPGLA